MLIQRRKTLLLDVDGVIADLSGEIVDVVNSHVGNKFTVDDITSYEFDKSLSSEAVDVRSLIERTLAEPGFAYSIKPYCGAVEFVNDMRSLADVCFVTMPHDKSQTWAYDRTEWLKRYFGAKSGDIYFACDKSRVMGDIFIDDNDNHVRSWALMNPVKQAFLFSRLYNSGSSIVQRVSCWADITKIVSAAT